MDNSKDTSKRRKAASKPGSQSRQRSRKIHKQRSRGKRFPKVILWCLAGLNTACLVSGAVYTHKNPDWWRLTLKNLGIDLAHRAPAPDQLAARIVAAAKAQEGTFYSAAYRNIAYPGGDVPTNKGACSDVVVRALRGAGYDLQQLLHDDIAQNWQAYPNYWGLQHPDANIDHRRVPNQMVFFTRHGQKLTNLVNAQTRRQWQPGDIVCWKTGPQRWHTGVVSDGLNKQGWPLVVHNGSICVEANCLTRWPIIGHYRYPKRKV